MIKGPNLDDTIVALATPYGKGAIAVIRLSGTKAIDIVNECFKGKDLTKVDTHTVHYGYLIKKEELVDEVMVSVFKAPKSYTTEDIVEVSCHGSTFLQDKIVQLFISHGARMADKSAGMLNHLSSKFTSRFSSINNTTAF